MTTTTPTTALRQNLPDTTARAHTMTGERRMRNLQECVEQVLRDDVPSDLIETGVWRGGACIFMRGLLAAYGEADRTVWVADSFSGLPAPDPRYAADAGDRAAVDDYRAVHGIREQLVDIDWTGVYWRRDGAAVRSS